MLLGFRFATARRVPTARAGDVPRMRDQDVDWDSVLGHPVRVPGRAPQSSRGSISVARSTARSVLVLGEVPMPMRSVLPLLALTAAGLGFAGCSSDDSGESSAGGGAAAMGGAAGGAGGGGTGGSTGGAGACDGFGPPVSSSEASAYSTLLLLLDVDCDGKLDAVSTSETGLTVRRAKGDGSFEDAPSLDLGMAPVGMVAVAGDFDGDGATDIVVSGEKMSLGGRRLSLVRGDCAKGLRAPVVIADPAPYSIEALATGDLNGDGVADVVVAYWTPPYAVQVLFGGASPLEQTIVSPALTDQAMSLSVGDFDGDGDVDVAAAGNPPSSLRLLLNDGAGNLTETAGVPLAGWMQAMAAIDLDGDGADELVTVQGTLVDALSFDAKSGQLSAQNLAHEAGTPRIDVADADGDGQNDLAMVWSYQQLWPHSRSPHTKVVFGGSNASTPIDVPFAGATPQSATLRIGDVTDDGRADLVIQVSDFQETSLEVFPAKTLECQHQAKSCGGPVAFGEVAYPLTLRAHRVAYGDVTGDGATDLVAVGDDELALLVNDGHGSFVAGPHANVPGIKAVAVGRVGPGGAPVVVVADGSSGWITFDAQGSLQKISAPGVGPISNLATGDMDGDGKEDLVVSTGPEWGPSVGSGKLFLVPGGDPDAAKWANDAQLVGSLDFDDDGDTDLIVVRLVGSYSGGPIAERCLVRAPMTASGSCEYHFDGAWLDLGDFDGDHQADFLSRSSAGWVAFATATARSTELLNPNEGWFSARIMQRKPNPALLLGMKGGELRVYAGAGGGKLSPGPPLISHQADRLLRYLDAEDLDGDGRDELVGIAWDPAPTLWVMKECP